MTISIVRRFPAVTRLVAFAVLMAAAPLPALAQDAKAILQAAFDNWRAESSHATVNMTVQRKGSRRNMTMESWTQGRDKALVRFTAPKRDAGNGTLQLGRSTWVFNPKLNQVIKLPASAMTQSWMGSDFSYNDLSRTEKLITDYTHRILSTKTSAGKKVYVIEAVPKPRKPVIWGKQIIEVRADGVLLQQEFYDQAGKLVRSMTADNIVVLSGRPYPVVMTMRTVAKPGQWTRITTVAAEFSIKIPNYVFTKSNLQNPRD